MFKPSATLHKSPTGALSVLACSEDASECLNAFKACNEPGEIAFLRKGHLDKFKKIPSTNVAKPKAAKKTAKKKTKILQ